MQCGADKLVSGFEVERDGNWSRTSTVWEFVIVWHGMVWRGLLLYSRGCSALQYRHFGPRTLKISCRSASKCIGIRGIDGSRLPGMVRSTVDSSHSPYSWRQEDKIESSPVESIARVQRALPHECLVGDLSLFRTVRAVDWDDSQGLVCPTGQWQAFSPFPASVKGMLAARAASELLSFWASGLMVVSLFATDSVQYSFLAPFLTMEHDFGVDSRWDHGQNTVIVSHFWQICKG